jgi:tetratricopeptide (TPR) repeat protein
VAWNKRLNYLIFFIISILINLDTRVSLAEDLNSVFNIDRLLEYRAENGLSDLEPHSMVFIDAGLKAYNEKDYKKALLLFEGAKELSPDLPLPYLYLAKVNFSLSSKGITRSSSYLLDAVSAFLRNFWWSFQTAGMFSISLYLTFYVSIIAFLIVLIASRFRLYLHDLFEDRGRILFLFFPLILSLLSPFLGLIGLILPFWIYLKKRERYMVCGIIVLIAFIISATPLFSSFLGALQDKSFFNIVRINKGLYTGEINQAIKQEDSYEAAFANALDLKRRGYYSEAKEIYERLLRQDYDPRVLVNLGNCYIGLGNYDTALKYYEKALQFKNIVSAYYNLSQIYRENFDFNAARKYYLKATEIDQVRVSSFDKIKGASVNRFVMDETFTNKDLWSLVFKRAKYYSSSRMIDEMFSFVNKEVSVALLFIFLLVFPLYGRRLSYGAYSCKRCGKIYCSRCEKKISHEDICHACFKTLMRMTELTPQERIERILEAQRHRSNRNRNMRILTFIFPGSGHVYYGCPGYGFMIMIGFTFFIFLTLLWMFFPTFITLDKVSSVFKWFSISGIIAVYLVAVMNILRRVA